MAKQHKDTRSLETLRANAMYYKMVVNDRQADILERLLGQGIDILVAYSLLADIRQYGEAVYREIRSEKLVQEHPDFIQ